MQAVIMAGGKGTRLVSVTKDEIPKPMALIAGKPLLLWQLEELRRNGVTDILIITGHLGQKIESYFQNGAAFGVRISYIREKEPLGTAGAFYYLRSRLAGQHFLLVFGDICFTADLGAMERFHLAHKAKATLFVHPNSHPQDSDLVVLDENQQVVQIVSKHRDKNQAYENCVNAGIYILDSSLCAYVCKAEKTDLEKDILMPLIESRQGGVFGYWSLEYAKDAGTAERIAQIAKDKENIAKEKEDIAKEKEDVAKDKEDIETVGQRIGKQEIRMDYRAQIKDYIELERKVLKNLDVDAIDQAMNLIGGAYEAGKRIYIFGNGGSSATASHYQNDFNKGISEHLEKKFHFVCLNDNMPTVMAIANDIGFEEVFRFQLTNRLEEGDLVIAISGSGNSENVLLAAAYAKECGNQVIGLTGYDGGRLKGLSDVSLCADVNSMQVTEDVHMLLDHLMMSIFYRTLCGMEHVSGNEAESGV